MNTAYRSASISAWCDVICNYGWQWSPQAISLCDEVIVAINCDSEYLRFQWTNGQLNETMTIICHFKLVQRDYDETPIAISLLHRRNVANNYLNTFINNGHHRFTMPGFVTTVKSLQIRLQSRGLICYDIAIALILRCRPLVSIHIAYFKLQCQMFVYVINIKLQVLTVLPLVLHLYIHTFQY